MNRLSAKGLGLAIGLIWGFGNLLVGWSAKYGWGGKYVDLMSSIYIGYGPSWVGGVIGGIWAFFDGAICGVLLALVYNRATKSNE